MQKPEAASRKPEAKRCGSILATLQCCVLLPIFFCGCATPRHFAGSRPFHFPEDTFAYANDLTWEYHFDANGKWVHQRRKPASDYTLHCFAVACAARQFFQNAKFDPHQPGTDEATYRELIRRVVAVDPAGSLTESRKIVIPGYANLRTFSEAREKLLKAECGGAWQSYFQRGNWRMVLPFSRASQEDAAQRLLDDLKDNRPPVVHVVRFPQLTINHAVLVFDAKESSGEIQFFVYDPNQPNLPKTLTFDRASRIFSLPANNYFPGGRVDVYEIYRDLLF